MKKGHFTFTGDSPLEITDDVDQDFPGLSDEQEIAVHQVAKTVKAYLKAAEELLNGKYAHIKDLAPIHLADPGNVLVACCSDGVVIRYERKTDQTDQVHVFGGWMAESMPEAASLLSQNLIHCYSDKNYTSTVPTTGTELKLSTQDLITKEKKDVISGRIGFDIVIERPDRPPQPPQKPFCLLSVQNAVEFQLLGEVLPADASIGEGQRFITRSMIRLPVGWECIEVFPFFDLEEWNPDYAPIWAENDLLAAVVAQQFHDAQFQSLDPKAEARRQYAELLQSFKELLDSNPEREQILQRFLQDNPALLCPTQIKVWPKLALGARKTDFVFQEAAGDYLLVELERSTLKLFLADGNQSRELTHARGQILDWKRYLEDNLSTVQRELGLVGISSNPKGLIVIGRSRSLNLEDRRNLTTIENESPKLKIMTYDDVYENAKAVVENLLGTILYTGGNTRIYYPQGT